MIKKHHIVIDGRIRRTSTGRYVDRLLEHLQSIDNFHRYTVLLQPDDDWQPRAKNFTPLPCPYPQFSLNPLHQIGFAWQLYRLKANLVHFTMTQQPLLYFGRIVATSHDTTMYNFIRKGDTPLPIYKVKIALYRFLVWWSHRKSTRIIVPTRTVANEFVERHPFIKNKVDVTYEASEPPLKVRAVRPDSVDPDEEFVLYVGTAFPHKNLKVLVDAIAILNKKHPKLKLVLTGKIEKHYEQLAEQIKDSPGADNIIMTGFVPDASLKWLYEHTRAYVFASLSEGFGLPPLEAMQHGAPVVSSNSSVMPEVYGSAAHYFDARSAKDCAAKIDEVVGSEKLRKELVQKGYKQVNAYSWRHMAEETLTVYKDALQE